MSTAIQAPASQPRQPARGWFQRWQEYIPEGRALPKAVWQRRHRGILLLLWAHVIALFGFGLLQDYSLLHAAGEVMLIAIPTIIAELPFVWRRLRTSMASLGLIMASAILVHFSGGYVEMHFHFFVMVAVVALYQDWITFFLAIGYVVIHHGIVGVWFPTAVYNHPDAIAHPWIWAFIHAAFVLGASIASIINWRLNESARATAESVLNSTSEGVCGLDYEGQIIFVNPAAARLLGDTTDRLIGRHLYNVVTHTNEDHITFSWVTSPIARALRSSAVATGASERFKRADQTEFPVEYTSTPLRHHRSSIGAVLSFQDQTERQKVQADQLRLQEQVITMQQSLLKDLSTPLIPINDDVVIVPLIGTIDSQRAQHMTASLLQGVAQHKPRVAIIDITGVPVVDQQVASALVQSAQAVRLLGTEVLLTGMRAEVAQALVDLDIDLSGIVTRRNLQDGIRYALEERLNPSPNLRASQVGLR